MIEIKYRAFDLTNKKLGMGEVITLFNGECKEEMCQILFDGMIKKWRFFTGRRKNCELMQYTGLKDKNDVEIYEGDIVAMEAYGFLKVVTFIEKLAAFCVKSEKGESLLSFYIEDIEVIGNIYENSELLKDKQC